jgi:hypothetical protein
MFKIITLFAQDDPVCHYNATKAVALVQDWNIVMRDWDNVTSPFTDPPFDEEAIKQAVDTIGPMSACIDVKLVDQKQKIKYFLNIFYMQPFLELVRKRRFL